MNKMHKYISFTLTFLLFVLFVTAVTEASDTTIGIQSSTSQVETNSATDTSLYSATLNGTITDTDTNSYDIRSFLFKIQGSNQWQSAESTSALLNNLTATFDGMLMTSLVATLHPSVTKIEVYKGTDKLVEWNDKQLQSLFVQYLLGATVNDVLTIKAYANGVPTNYNVKVQTYQPLYNKGPFNMNLIGLSPGTTYEYKAIAHNSKEWKEGSIQTFTTKGDMNGDGIINLKDLLWMSSRIGPANNIEIKNADVNNDGTVNILDLQAVANIDL